VSGPLSSTVRSANALPSTLRGVLAGWRPWALLAALCLTLYLPGIASMPPLDRDESRFAQATRQMLETGDYVRIRFQDEARNKKPVGIYWLQAASVSLFGSAEGTTLWPYRIPSLLGALAAVLLTFQCGRRLFGTGREGTAAALLGAGCSPPASPCRSRRTSRRPMPRSWRPWSRRRARSPASTGGGAPASRHRRRWLPRSGSPRVSAF
jgi:hypothetical protein